MQYCLFILYLIPYSGNTTEAEVEMKKLFALILIVLVFGLLAYYVSEKPIDDQALVSIENDIRVIPTSLLNKVEYDMTFRQVITLLGPTKDVGSGMHVAIYGLQEGKTLKLSYADLDDTCPYNGEDLLKKSK